MNRATRPPELALPIAALHALRGHLAEEVGNDAAARALRAAGHAAGDALFAAFAASGGMLAPDEDAMRERLAGIGSHEFWRRLAAFFAARGWGHLHFRQLHDGVGALESRDWVEAVGDASRPSCHFTTGALANLLGHVAAQPVAVLEAECRSQGDERCSFLFGASESIHVLFGDLTAGTGLEQALLELV
jgi:predicted hydrocarbon binding protein